MAYVMRISDWSSDVCSSDLTSKDAHVVTVKAIICRATGSAYTNETQAYLRGSEIDNASEEEITDDAKHVRHGEIPDGGGKKTGRATCGERVGQYGLIVGDDGTLKKR